MNIRSVSSCSIARSPPLPPLSPLALCPFSPPPPPPICPSCSSLVLASLDDCGAVGTLTDSYAAPLLGQRLSICLSLSLSLCRSACVHCRYLRAWSVCIAPPARRRPLGPGLFQHQPLDPALLPVLPRCADLHRTPACMRAAQDSSFLCLAHLLRWCAE